MICVVTSHRFLIKTISKLTIILFICSSCSNAAPSRIGAQNAFVLAGINAITNLGGVQRGNHNWLQKTAALAVAKNFLIKPSFLAFSRMHRDTGRLISGNAPPGDFTYQPFAETQAFNAMIGFESTMLLPSFSMVNFISPRQTAPFTEALYIQAAFEPMIRTFNIQHFMQVIEFNEKIGHLLTMPVKMIVFCYCFENRAITKLTGNGIMEMDFIKQTGRITDMAMQNAKEQAVRGTISFQFDQHGNRFSSSYGVMRLHLNNTNETLWKLNIIGADESSNYNHTQGAFAAHLPNNAASIIGHFTTR